MLLKISRYYGMIVALFQMCDSVDIVLSSPRTNLLRQAEMARALRSSLFDPATDLRKNLKALSLKADAAILDRQVAVAASEKVPARSPILVEEAALNVDPTKQKS
ncbi:MAG: hypothetical protein AB1473_03110 [Thermodesulfobacteriota bacterium]